MESGEKAYVYWIERRGRGTFLQATPIDVSQLLDEKLFDAIDTAILTSATLAVAGEFEFTKQRLGLRNARTLVVESHFDYNQQALLYVPQELPDPRSPAFTSAAAREIIEILTHSRGRAFVLFTSYQQMRLIYDKVSLEVPYRDAAARHRPAQRAAGRISRHPQLPCCSRRRHSGRAWTCRANN